MAATGLYRYYSGLPGWARAVVIIALILLIIIVIFWIKKLIKQAQDKANQSEKDQEYIKDYQKYCSGSGNEGKSSYPAGSYIQMASSIFEAGCYESYLTCGGTDEKAIKSVFEKMNSVCDVLQLVQAFGERTHRTMDLNDFANSLNPFSSYTSQKYPLGAWLRTEMSADEVQKNVNDVLKSRGISYSF